MPRYARGLYEVLVTDDAANALERLDERLEAELRGLRSAEAADRVALHLSRVVERAVASLGDKERVARGIQLARTLIDTIDRAIAPRQYVPDRPRQPGRVLHAIRGHLPDGRLESIEQPLLPLLDTTMLTNAPGEPGVGHQIRAEIQSADHIDLVMAFIRRSGIKTMLDPLRAHCAAGRPLRVLTTTYTGSTEARALDELRDLGAEVRVSYDDSSTRLHAKAWLFHRESGFSTAYVGSSNLTHSAQVSGLEWNVRISGVRNPHVIERIVAAFDGYWNDGDFVPYDSAQFSALVRASRTDAIELSPFELQPKPFQERMLEQIALSRQRGHHRNLLVSATGTGKTVMAVLDYARLRQTLPRSRLLFVAHRTDILEQSRRMFRHGLRDPTFGERWGDGERPERFEHVFASIQSLQSTGLEHLDPGQFDIVIIDEFHHAAAPSYVALLEHLQPQELLGLTATPERSDGLPVLDWFDGRISAELRLWDAIEQHHLAPFVYYGIHDDLDLRALPWRRGRYDVEGLSNLLTGNDVWARFVIKAVHERVDDVSRMHALGFCVSVEHARFMARVFTDAGIRAQAIWSDTPTDERRRALDRLAAGELAVVFSVDLFNEGMDVPAVDTLLMLRPTESPTLFIQQLGRGLRRSPGKTVCTVLDFVGHHRAEFRFDRRLQALLGGTRRELERQVRDGFPFLPAGCHMELDRVATQIVLESIRNAVPSKWTIKVAELRALERDGMHCSLIRYLQETGLGLEDVYPDAKKGWSSLRADAGLRVLGSGPHERALRSACGRLLHIDDMVRIESYRRLLSGRSAPVPERLDPRDRRLLRMLVGSIVDQVVTTDTTLAAGSRLLWKHPQVRAELLELLDVLAGRVDHVTVPLSDRPEVPLQVHARYTRIEILAAFGIRDGAKVPAWQTGVYWAEAANADLLAFTLDKTKGQFSPTTRYRDYAISRELIHWESQSVTRADGKTGLRYQQHARRGSDIMLFARLRTDQRAFHFLGPATYVRHEAEQPMAITWRLRHALPGDLFASFAAVLA
ncbi:DEAD/DEAH box helicase [Paraliomyxa miuraensis]|uniref:DEAD/DEAH box helicase n=1 Tax=Paraliomyxa miuraensis TaxID=376150 RepID=UPI002255109B|nr:DEAD/DEAH box helicase [Paraliomyxa miuraensis]MCX4244241.1 DUF3427 domain-containing protein [Paraliomyxa miuraensis]